MSDEPRRKLIEVALPLEAINRESAREKSIRHGHPSTLHLWWARRPLAACRAVLFASLVDDPSSRPDLYSDEEADAERERLFRLMERLVTWEATTDERLLEEVREEILRSTDGSPPPVLDPFCGGGSIPLEAQRLGTEVHASDLNPVAVLITKALTEIPSRFQGAPPVNPKAEERLETAAWKGAHGLAADVRYYGEWLRGEAERRIGDRYVPPGDATAPAPPPIAWLWARTVRCPNPACQGTVPLVRSFWLSKKQTKPTWVQPIVDRSARTVSFEVHEGGGDVPESTVDRRGGRCLVCGNAIPFDHIRDEGRQGRMGVSLMAVVAEGDRERLYFSPTPEDTEAAGRAHPAQPPESELPERALGFRVQAYGITTHAGLFTNRQLLALETFADLIELVRPRVTDDAERAGLVRDGVSLDDGGTGADAYGDAVATYLGLCVSRFADRNNNLCTWDSGPATTRASTGGSARTASVRNAFARQTLAMTWDFAEAAPFGSAGGSFSSALDWVVAAVSTLPGGTPAVVRQLDAAAEAQDGQRFMVATDPPYYDNIGYADLSDFFYIWLRRALRDVFPNTFSTLLVPKTEELIATPYRFAGSKTKAREHFEEGLRRAFSRVRQEQHPDFPFTVFYAFKQAEQADGAIAVASTGWETMLEGLLGAGFTISGTWPMRSELSNRMLASGTNALASSVVLVCRPRPAGAAIATRKEFSAALRAELPEALRRLQSGSIAPVDLAQAAIGPGMAVFSRYAKVVEADGGAMRVRSALARINEALDEMLAEQEADFDRDTRWCVSWFEQYGMNEGPFGVAETLSRAKNTAINGLVDAGVVQSRGGKVRLLDRGELEATWEPARDTRLTVWEVAQHLIARHQEHGEQAAAALLRQVGGGLAEVARELAYRLFAICERKGWAHEALAYNALVSAWPEITRLAAQAPEVGDAGEQEAMEI